MDLKILLDEKLLPDVIKGRVHNGKTLSYIEGYYAENNANRIFDYKWSKELLKLEKLFERPYSNKEGKPMVEVAYMATVRVTIPELEIFRDGTGAGNGQSSNLFGAYELAIKEAETDAMKRALKSLGNQFGIELYDKGYDPRENYADGVAVSLELVEAKEALAKATTKEAIQEIYKNYSGAYRKEFEKACMERKKQLC
jgi:recombination DNA repair RAD52 pathway protein